jgi:hypothetical protein
MKVYKLNFKLHNARPLDYERLHRELKTELFSKLHKLDLATKYDPERWVEYLYQKATSKSSLSRTSSSSNPPDQPQPEYQNLK